MAVVRSPLEFAAGKDFLAQGLAALAAPGVSGEDRLALALALLREGDFQARWAASQVLVALGPVATEPVLALLESEAADPDLGWFVARVLGRSGDPVVAERVVALAISAPDAAVREAAAGALGQLAVAFPAERGAVLATLERLLAEPGMARAAVVAIARLGVPEAGPLLRAALALGDPAVRAAAIAGLAAPPHAAAVETVAGLVAALDDGAAIVRRAAAIALGAGRAVALPPELAAAGVAGLAARLHDAEPGVVAAAAQALGRWAGTAAGTALLAGLAKAQGAAAAAIAHALVRREDPVLWHQVAVSWAQWPDAVQQEIVRSLAGLTTSAVSADQQRSAGELILRAIAALTAKLALGSSGFPPPNWSEQQILLAAAAARWQVAEARSPLREWLAACPTTAAGARLRLHVSTALRSLPPGD